MWYRVLIFVLQHSDKKKMASLLFIVLEKRSNAQPFNLRGV